MNQGEDSEKSDQASGAATPCEGKLNFSLLARNATISLRQRPGLQEAGPFM